MSGLPDIRDRESLEAWLKTRPPGDSLIIAHRAAMRVLPIWLDAVARNTDLTALTILRCHLMSRVARNFPTRKFKAAARTASYAASARGPAASPAAPARASASAASYASSAASARGPAASFAVSARASVATEAAARAAGYAAAYAAADLWEAVSGDVATLLAGGDPLDDPLWPSGDAVFALSLDAQLVLGATPGGTFWQDFYQRSLDGRPQNLPLLRDIALIPHDKWTAAADPKNAAAHATLHRAITEIVEHHAVAATANGESIEPDPSTGLLQLVPQTALPGQIADYARRKIAKAIAIFDGQTEQQYGALAPDLAMLRDAITDAGNLPVELLDVCAAASRRLTIRVTRGDCPAPEQDPLVADYLHRLREAGADILANDPETQAVLERRASITPNTALIDARDDIEAVAAVAAQIAQGRLANTLPKDAATATDPDLDRGPDPETRAAAAFRLSGRLLRIASYARDVSKGVAKGFAIGNAGFVGVATYAQVLDYLANSPVIKAAKEAIFRYLGF